MNENWAIALAMFCLGQAAFIITAGIGAFMILTTRINESQVKYEHRFTELETKCERWFVATGTNTLHRDDDKYGIDKDIERFGKLYREHSCDMPSKEWVYYFHFFKKLAANELATPNERLLAESFVDLCAHKMKRDGTFPCPPKL